MKTTTATIAGVERGIHLCQTAEDVETFLRWASTRPALAVDTETTTYKRWTDPDYRLRLIQFGDADTAYCLPPTLSDAAAVVLRGARTLAFANAPFDIGVLSEIVPAAELWPKAHDVLVMAHLLDSRGRRLGGCPLDLKSLSYYAVEGLPLRAILYTKGGVSTEKKDLRTAAKSHGYKKAGDEFVVLPIDDETYLRYSGADAIYTYRLAAILGRFITESKLGDLYERERRFASIVHAMECRGFSLNERHARDTATMLDDDVAAIRLELDANWGLCSPNSPGEVVSALTRHGVAWPSPDDQPDHYTPKGKPSAARHVLESLDHPLAAALLDYRAEHKALVGCVRPLLAATGSDGRVHPSFKTLGAVTGRMSCKQPNLQQMPKRRGTAERMRACLQAGEGLVIVSADLSQIEYRVAASLSKDEQMLAAYRDDADLHVRAAELIFQTTSPTGAQRTLAKTAGFGKIYGAGAATMARQTGTSTAAAQRVIDAYDENFVGLSSWSHALIDDVVAQLDDSGAATVTTRYGRSIPVDPDRPYAAVNYVCQSTARDVLVDWVFALESTAGLMAIIHDELVFEIDPREADDLKHSLEAAATRVELDGVPVLADAGVGGRDWGSLYRKDSPPADTDREDTE